MSSSSSDMLVRLGSALAASGALHLGVGLAVEALPWSAGRSEERAPVRDEPRLQVDLRLADGPAAPASQAQAKKPAAPAAERYYLARELDVRPAAQGRIAPAYPNDAFLRDISGRVVIRLYIAQSGTVEKTVIVHAEPPGYFEEAVQQAFRAARFTPAMKNGRAVKAQVVLEVRYDSPRRLTPQ